MRHVDLAAAAQALVIAPATANTVGKMANGIADNLLTTLCMAVKCPVIVVPSMNEQMFASPALCHNLDILRSRGCYVMEPGEGKLACGVVGKGRMPEPQDIFSCVRAGLTPKDFDGVRALITAGPTREHLDPVRFLSNPSSGRMGYCLAGALAERGAAVTLISGPSELPCPRAVELVPVTTAVEMHRAVLERFEQCDLVIKAAAVADYRPADGGAPQKMKKGAARISLEMVATPDILKSLAARKGKRVLVGFAAETENVLENARQKLRRKNLDLIVANDSTAAGAGFAVATNRASLVDARGEEELPLLDKEELAQRILDRVVLLVQGKAAKR